VRGMTIDFSPKHRVFLKDRESGLLRRMDEPYYTAQLVGDGVWQIGSDGCYAFLVEGDSESVLIDTGYGAGNIRSFAQCLTLRPLRRVINTHDHFDHTALNGLFDCAVMSAATAPLATRPFPSFSGIEFPTEYEKEIVRDGDCIELGGRSLRVFEIPDHAVGSIALLDSRSRILFIGDECSRFGKDVSGSVQDVAVMFRRLAEARPEFDRVAQNHMGLLAGDIVERIAQNLEHILAGNEGEPDAKPPFRLPEPEMLPTGEEIWLRDLPHPGDVHPKGPGEKQHLRVSRFADCEVKYDLRRITSFTK